MAFPYGFKALMGGTFLLVAGKPKFPFASSLSLITCQPEPHRHTAAMPETRNGRSFRGAAAALRSAF
jgi:hypothetical protein